MHSLRDRAITARISALLVVSLTIMIPAFAAAQMGGMENPVFNEVNAEQEVIDALFAAEPTFQADPDGLTDITWLMDPYGLTTVYLVTSAGANDQLWIDTELDTSWMDDPMGAGSWWDRWWEWLEGGDDDGEGDDDDTW
ncbi:MAG: hypothetical protein AAFX05_01145 [Planctomycetota bacterium]